MVCVKISNDKVYLFGRKYVGKERTTEMKKRLYSLCFLAMIIVAMFLAGCKEVSQGDNPAETDERIEQAIKSGIPTVLVSNTMGKPGDTVTITATLINNPGILGSAMTLSYDEEVLRLKRVENGAAFKESLNMSNSKELKSGCVFLWDGEAITEEQILDGVILSMEFEVLKEPVNNASPVILVCHEDGTVDSNLEIVDLKMEKGIFRRKD